MPETNQPQTARIHRPLYRVFHLNHRGGIDRADIIEAIDDEDAIGRMHAMADDHAVELWDRARFVAKVEPSRNALVPEPVVVRVDLEPIVSPLGLANSVDLRKLVH